MQNFLNNLKIYSPTVLRIGMAIIAIWFGAQELLNPQMWTSYIPDSVVNFSNLNANFLVHLNGSFELIFGLALLLGIKTRITALLLTLHMFDITYVVGYGALGIRDLGLALGLLAVLMHGPSLFSFDTFKNFPQNRTDGFINRMPVRFIGGFLVLVLGIFVKSGSVFILGLFDIVVSVAFFSKPEIEDSKILKFIVGLLYGLILIWCALWLMSKFANF